MACRFEARVVRAAVLGALLFGLPDLSCAGDWRPLARDALHDPANPSLRLLQEPREALSLLPPSTTGNQVNWVGALEDGYINPRSNLTDAGKARILDSDILLNLQGGTPIVRFPHRQHTEWLDCNDCHEALFKSKVGANRLSMLRILQGEQCGVCHGAVAFPLIECNRCHSVPRAPARAGPP
jgi:c(7)-type cytochrome triheme protein